MIKKKDSIREYAIIPEDKCKKINQTATTWIIDKAKGWIVQEVGDTRFYFFQWAQWNNYGWIALDNNNNPISFNSKDNKNIVFELFDNLKVDRNLWLCHDDWYILTPVEKININIE